MDLQNVLGAMRDIDRDDRSFYHLTLGELIETLRGVPDKSIPVRYEDGGSPGEPYSYRGFYVDLSFEDAPEPRSVAEVLAAAEGALGEELQGWKGGYYLMDEAAPLWRADEGSTGPAILFAIVEPDAVRLLTKTR